MVLNRVLSCGATWKRILAGAVIGGLWACVVSLCPGMPWAVQAAGTYVAAAGLMAVTAFRLRRLKDIAGALLGMYLVSVVLGGMMLAVYEHTSAGYYIRKALTEEAEMPALFWILASAAAAAVCYGLSGKVKGLVGRLAGRRDLWEAVLYCGSEKTRIRGIIDTGNRLREPVTGSAVHVTEEKVMRRLCPVVKGVVYVPYQSVGGRGILPAVYIDRMEIWQQGERVVLEKPLIAISRQKLSPSGEYELLIQRTAENRRDDKEGR